MQIWKMKIFRRQQPSTQTQPLLGANQPFEGALKSLDEADKPHEGTRLLA